MVDIAQEALREYQELTDIISDSQLIGGIYDMNYDEATVLSNDSWKEDAGGVPEHCFLLATSANWEQGDEFNADDAYAILMRAQGPAELTNENELREVRQKAMREMITGDDVDEGPVVGTPEQFLDILTQNEIQFSGINAKILGTFYQEDGELEFGSDIDTFYSSARYSVYKPTGDALSRLASYPVDVDEEGGVPIGQVQYSSTQRNERENARVEVNVEDFIGNKTAVFGMTRTGKSNTLKIIATAVYEHSAAEGEKVGQLLFDPQGEYANPNQQDEMALAELGTDSVTIYRLGADGSEEGVEPLQIDFFTEENIEAAWARVSQELQTKEGTDYLDAFKNVELVGPPEEADWGAATRAYRRRTAVHATFAKAGLEIPDDYEEWIPVAKDVYDVVDNNASVNLQKPNSDVLLTDDTLLEFWETVAKNRSEVENAKDGWIDEDLEYILDVLSPSGIRSGYKTLTGLDKFHEPGAEGDYAEKIYQDLCDGKIAIVDMTLGLDEVVQDVSERVVRHIMARSLSRFTNDETLPNIQIFLEEAHQLLDSDSFDEANDPYVRLAKEGAKFELGMIYATQEVTGVDRRILANTANWVITHLNNTNETNRLGDYYNFKDFERPIREIEDQGFARIKMKSGKYIVPTQIDLFDADRLEEARETARQQSDRGD